MRILVGTRPGVNLTEARAFVHRWITLVTLLCDHIIPFTPQGRVDLALLRVHLLWMQAHGVDGFVSCGAELAHLDHKEKEQIFEVVTDAASLRPVIATVWDPSPTRALRLAEQAIEHGVTAILVPPPLLAAVAEATLVEWYRAFARNLPMPVYAWHATRFGNDIGPALAARLYDEAGVAGLLDASEDVFRVRRLAAGRPDGVLAVADGTPAMAEVPHLAGVVSTIANCWPTLAARAFKQREAGVVDAVPLRARAVARAGGVAAMKRLLGMGARLPLVGVDEDELNRLPPTEFR